MTPGDRGYSIHERVFEHAEMVHILGTLDRAELIRTQNRLLRVAIRKVHREPSWRPSTPPLSARKKTWLRS
jgi:hypothetical protein